MKHDFVRIFFKSILSFSLNSERRFETSFISNFSHYSIEWGKMEKCQNFIYKEAEIFSW